jgi:PAS domain S-box-containing protein
MNDPVEQVLQDSVRERAATHFQYSQNVLHRRIDRLFCFLLALQWLGGIAAALWISPKTWIGTVSQTHWHVWAAIYLGGALAAFPVLLAHFYPGRTITRQAIAIAQALSSALLIHLTGGRIETHFHVFGSLAFLAFYRDWRVLLTATLVVAGDHLARGLFWPQSVFGVLSTSPWRWLEHAGWVAFEDTFLFISIRQSLLEMREVATRRAGLESLNERFEMQVAERTRDLETANAALLAENTERRRGEETLRESEGKFRQLAENISDVFYITSPDLQQIHYVSPAYEHIWGRPATELYAKPQEWIEAILPEERDGAIKTFRRLEEEGPAVSVEFRIARPDGEVRWILNRGFQIRDAAGKVTRLMGVASDITERKLSESALEKVNSELHKVARQAGMAEVATSVLHNVGNVLNSINVSLNVLSGRVKNSKSGSVSKVAHLLKEHETDLGDFISKDAKGRQVQGFLVQLAAQLGEEKNLAMEELTSLAKNVDHIKDIVAMQQSYAKVSGVTETVSIIDLVEDALRMNASMLIRHDVNLLREYDEHLPEITVEKHKALQILVNLIRNAKESCAESGRENKHLTMRITNGSAVVRIALSDNGVGIPTENLTRVFNHGFTTKSDGHGFGLHSGALAAREMGGTLRVQSDGLGKGATFILELPGQPKAQQGLNLPIRQITNETRSK